MTHTRPRPHFRLRPRPAEIADKFLSRSRVLAADGYIVYDIQDEPGRTGIERPFPFRRVMDSSGHASLLARSSGRDCVVYKCVADPEFHAWLGRARDTHGHSCVNLVGRASSGGEYRGPTISEAMAAASRTDGVEFGCVCIAERHTVEAARARGRDYPTEHINMVRKLEVAVVEEKKDRGLRSSGRQHRSASVRPMSAV